MQFNHAAQDGALLTSDELEGLGDAFLIIVVGHVGRECVYCM